MLPGLLTVALAATPALKLGAPGFTAVNLPDAEAAFLLDHFAQRMAAHGVEVLTPSTMAAILGHERERQLLGCAGDDEGCETELAAALGVEGLAIGSVALLHRRYQLNVRIVSAGTGAQLAAFSTSADDKDGLLAALDRGARDLAAQLVPHYPALAARDRRRLRRWAWLPAAGGVVAAGAGAALMASSRAQHRAMASGAAGPFSSAQGAADYERRGRIRQQLGVGGLGLGAAALVGAGALFLAGGETSVAVAVAPSASPGFAGLGIAGTFR